MLGFPAQFDRIFRVMHNSLKRHQLDVLAPSAMRKRSVILTVSLISRRTRLVGLLNRPQRKSLSRTESGILKVNKINPAIVTSTDQRFVVSKNEGGERASIFPGLNSNDHVILVDQLMGGDNFCGNGGHSRHFRRKKSRPIEPASPILFSIG